MAIDASWTIGALLSQMRGRGDAPALTAVQGGALATQSHRDVAGRALALGAGLRADGVVPGDMMALLAPNGPDWVIARLGIAASGAIAVAIDDLATDSEIIEILRDSGAHRALASPAHAAAAAQAFPEMRVHVIADEAADGRPSWRALFADEAPTETVPGDIEAMVVYTSGTTGAPKPFALTYANIAANVAALAATGVVRADDRVLLPLPLHHVYPLVVGVLTPLAAGASVVFPEAVTGAEIAAALRSARVTIMIGVPRLYAALLDGMLARAAAKGRVTGALFRAFLRLSVAAKRRWNLRLGRLLFGAVHRQLGADLRVMVSGGAKLEPGLIDRLQGLGWQVLSGYGLAETASIFTGNLPGRQRIGSEGQALGAGRMRIADADAEGIGEIQLEGPSVFAGYARAEANRDVFTEDGWFRTGDLGHLDQDGYVYVTGRAKEVIVLGGGKNVFPDSLEKHYGASPFIKEIAVLEHKGALVALVLPDMAALQAGGKTRAEQAIRVALASAAQTLPSYQRLAGFALTREALPRTRLSKYQRFRLPALYEAARASPERRTAAPTELSPADRELLARAPAGEILSLLERRYRDAAVTLDASPQLDLGIDSLEWMGLAAELESRFALRIGDAALGQVTTVRELIAAAADAKATGAPAPTTEADLRWIERPGAGSRLFAAVVYWLNRWLMRALFGLRTEGLAQIPAGGATIIVANHVSDLDPLVMAAVLPWRQMRRTWWGGDAVRLFGSAFMRRLARAAQIFPVDELAPARALDLGTRILARGEALIWFPESWRSPDGSLQEFLPGIGLLVARSGATVVPAHIDGAFAAMPRDRRLPRPVPIRIRFGAPIPAASVGGTTATPQEIARRLREAVAQLAPDSAR